MLQRLKERAKRTVRRKISRSNLSKSIPIIITTSLKHRNSIRRGLILVRWETCRALLRCLIRDRDKWIKTFIRWITWFFFRIWENWKITIMKMLWRNFRIHLYCPLHQRLVQWLVLIGFLKDHLGRLSQMWEISTQDSNKQWIVGAGMLLIKCPQLIISDKTCVQAKARNLRRLISKHHSNFKCRTTEKRQKVQRIWGTMICMMKADII